MVSEMPPQWRAASSKGVMNIVTISGNSKIAAESAGSCSEERVSNPV